MTWASLRTYQLRWRNNLTNKKIANKADHLGMLANVEGRQLPKLKSDQKQQHELH